MSEFVFLKNKKGSSTRRVTKMAWKKAGKREKSRFEEITEQQAKDLNKFKEVGSSNAAPDEVTNEQLYKQLIEQAKGFVKDEKYDKALEKYNDAQKLKDSPYIKGLITRTTKIIEEIAKENEEKAQEEQKQKGYSALVESGDIALNDDDDPVMALEFYENAKELLQTDEIDEKIKKCKELIDEDGNLVE